MSAIELKTAFHQLIDGINDENCLKDLYDSANVFVEHRLYAMIDDDSERIRQMLEKSVKNIGKAQTLTTEELRNEIKLWPRSK